jgi:hypothetical protein
MGRRGIRRMQLLQYLKKNRGYRKMKGEALDRTVWRTGFGRTRGPCREADYEMNQLI